MASTTMATTNTYELQDTAHREYLATNGDVSLRSDDEIRPTNSRNNQQQPTISSDVITPAFHSQLQAIGSTQIRSPRASLIIFHLSIINFLSSVTTGLIVVALPRIASDLALPERFYLWPSSVYGLTCGSTLLLAGAIADVVGARSVELVGCALLGVFTLACGLSHTGIQLVVFRAFQGIATAMHLPCSVALVTQFVPSGKSRNIGFSCLGLSMPLGFSVGLVVGGILVDTIGWRVGYYVSGAVLFVQAAAAFKIIPPDSKSQNIMSKLKKEIDWLGAMIACTSLAMFSYVLAILSADNNNIREPSSIVMLVVSVALMVAFPFWMRFQEKRGLPALVPNYLWKNIPFSSICALTVLTWGVQNSMELFSSLYFQEVQELSALQASLRILPSLIIAVILNFSTGYLIDKAPAFWVLLITMTLTAGAPLLMATISPQTSYWKGAFFAQMLEPLGGDVLFTVGLIVVSEVFPEKTQALAGAVFNTVAAFGMSLGLNLMQVVSLWVTKGTSYRDKGSAEALLKGYQASFWAMFASTMFCAFICVFGLRKIGKIGLKRE